MTTFIVIVGLVFLILIHEFGHFLAARLFKVNVEEFGIGYPPRIWGRKKNGVMWSINALPFGGFVKILGEDGGSDDPNSFTRQAVWKRSIILLAGVFMNLVAGWIFFSGVYMAGSPQRAIIMEVKEGAPAAIAGLRQGDMILGMHIGNASMRTPNADEFMSFTKQYAGKEVVFEISRAGKTEIISITPRENPPEGEGALGVAITDAGFKKMPVLKALSEGFLTLIHAIDAIVLGLVHFFGNLFSPGAFESVAGPIGVVSMAAKMGEFGLAYVFQIIGLISINLAILNVIPFPALDGGRVLFLIIEKFRGKPAPERVEQWVNLIGFGALIVLMIVVTFKDVTRLFH